MANRAERRRAVREHRPPPGQVAIAWLHPGHVAGAFMDSVVAVLMHDVQAGIGRIIGPGGGVLAMQSSPRVAEARSQIVQAFLTNEEFRGARWLWFIDSDMTFPPDTLERLVASAETHDAMLIGGLCFAGGRGGRMYPTIYDLQVSSQGVPFVEPIMDYPRDTVVKAGATGAACTLIRRELLIAMADDHPRGFGTFADGRPNPYPWYQEGLVDVEGRPLGEDIAFCMRANMLGAGVHIDTAVKIGHVKEYELTEELFDLTRSLAAGKAVDTPDDLGPSPLVSSAVEDHDDEREVDGG